jgi:hypothetical protein
LRNPIKKKEIEGKFAPTVYSQVATYKAQKVAPSQ